MNPFMLLFAVVGSVGFGIFLVASIVDHWRALAVAEAEAFEFRRRLQVAHMVIADLVERPDCEAARSMGRSWLAREHEVNDSGRVFRVARRLAAQKDNP